jgi:microcystin-dependent protein
MEAFVGTICAYGFNYAPYGWSFCAGQIISIQSNTALFSLLGTVYGGNGTSNFGLPNLQGRVAIGQGSNSQSNYVMGEFGGNDAVTVLGSNLPPHTHSVTLAISSNVVAQDSLAPGTEFPAANELLAVFNYATTPTPSKFMKPPTVTLGNTGGTTPVGVQDPGLVLNYCICQYGIFPSRN